MLPAANRTFIFLSIFFHFVGQIHLDKVISILSIIVFLLHFQYSRHSDAFPR